MSIYKMYCDCEDYKKSAEQIFTAQILAHEHGFKYTGEVWDYCPWCGKELVKEYT